MSSDIEFSKLTDSFMEKILESLIDEDLDELDCDLAMGVLTIEFEDGTKFIMNRQTAAHQIWLAAGASAWHFQQDEAGEWLDTKGRGPLQLILEEVLSAKLGRPISL